MYNAPIDMKLKSKHHHMAHTWPYTLNWQSVILKCSIEFDVIFDVK